MFKIRGSDRTERGSQTVICVVGVVVVVVVVSGMFPLTEQKDWLTWNKSHAAEKSRKVDFDVEGTFLKTHPQNRIF